ncbi:hypothetical protein DL96DRAFT_1816501 [Flagelloscypha sp. PMI_526]|nr:hypothetical protein DL96DRAFT_1816501 [Flagelloscypha sp. PMI_526]
MSSDPHYDAKLDGTIGCLFWGMLAATGLWGIGALQMWYYFDKYRNDKKAHIILVCLVFASDTCHQGLIMHALYMYCIRRWGNLDALSYLTTSLYQDVTLNGITGYMVQCFFVHRIWAFKKNILVVSGIFILITANLVLQFVYVALGAHLPTFTSLLSIKAISLSINALTAVCDVLISIAMCQDLYRAKTGFAWSDSVINRLMLFAINSGLVTSLCAVGSLLFYLALPKTLVYFGLYLTIGRLYQNSLLATLNARKYILSGGNNSQPESHSLPNRTSGRRVALGRGSDQTKTGTQIQVQIETIQDYSGMSEMEKDIDAATRDDMSSTGRDVKVNASAV